MLIYGAGGLAKQILPIVKENGYSREIFFYDDFKKLNSYLDFPVLESEIELKKYLSNNPEYLIGSGKPSVRRNISEICSSLGGFPANLVAKSSILYSKLFGNGRGIQILNSVIVEANSKVGDFCLINNGSIISHDCDIGNFCEIAPKVVILGECSIGDDSFIGAGAVINPGVRIGKNVVIGSGAVVTRDIEDHSLAVGVPAVVIKKRDPLVFT